MKGLSFDEEPNYDDLKSLFSDLLRLAGYSNDHMFDWLLDPKDRPSDRDLEKLCIRRGVGTKKSQVEKRPQSVTSTKPGVLKCLEGTTGKKLTFQHAETVESPLPELHRQQLAQIGCTLEFKKVENVSEIQPKNKPG